MPLHRDERQMALVGTAFAYAVGGAGEATRSKGFFVDGFDFGVMRRGFRQVYHVGKGHGLCVPVRQGRSPPCGSVRQSAPVRRGRPFVVGRTEALQRCSSWDAPAITKWAVRPSGIFPPVDELFKGEGFWLRCAVHYMEKNRRKLPWDCWSTENGRTNGTIPRSPAENSCDRMPSGVIG